MDEQEQNKKNKVTHKSAAKKIMSSSKKDRQISVKMSSEMYNQFTQINKARGMSNNSTINMIILIRHKPMSSICTVFLNCVLTGRS